MEAEDEADPIDNYQLILTRRTERGRAVAEPTQTDVTRDSAATHRTPRQHIRTNLCNSGESSGEGERAEGRKRASAVLALGGQVTQRQDGEEKPKTNPRETGSGAARKRAMRGWSVEE